MLRGIPRSLSALIGGAAFAVAVAGPPQWDPCPMHGVAPRQTAGAMQMPAGHDMQSAFSQGGATHRHAKGHDCTCPGGCCATSPVGLRVPEPGAPAGGAVVAAARLAAPRDAAGPASSPQLALPLAQAPPASGSTLPRAARPTT